VFPHNAEKRRAPSRLCSLASQNTTKRRNKNAVSLIMRGFLLGRVSKTSTDEQTRSKRCKRADASVTSRVRRFRGEHRHRQVRAAPVLDRQLLWAPPRSAPVPLPQAAGCRCQLPHMTPLQNRPDDCLLEYRLIAARQSRHPWPSRL